MTDKDRDDPAMIELVAIDRGFVNGRLVEPGSRFRFRCIGSDGKPRKIPKWATKPGDLGPAKQPKSGDIRPKDAQLAAKGKTDAMASGLA